MGVICFLVICDIILIFSMLSICIVLDLQDQHYVYIMDRLMEVTHTHTHTNIYIYI